MEVRTKAVVSLSLAWSYKCVIFERLAMSFERITSRSRATTSPGKSANAKADTEEKSNEGSVVLLCVEADEE